MATTGMLTADNNTAKLWSKVGFTDMYKRTMFGKVIQEGALFQADELTGKSVGDRVRYNFTSRLTGVGIGEGGTQQGNEEALAFDSHDLTIGLFRHAVNNPNSDSIEQQRTNIPFDERTTKLLSKYHGTRIDASTFQQLGGANPTSISIEGATYTGTDRLFVTGLNAVTAPTTNRIDRPGAIADDESLTSTDTLTLDMIDDALVTISQTTPSFEPFDNERFMLIVSPRQMLDLKRDTSGSINLLSDIIVPESQGSGNSDLKDINVLMMQKPQARYANVDIFVSPNVAFGVNSGTNAAIPTTRRALLLGKNAGVFGSPFGRISEGNTPFTMHNQLTDYNYFKGTEARIQYGLNKVVFDSEDYGVFVLSTYSAV